MGVGTIERVASLTERLRAAQHVLATAEAAAGMPTALPAVGPGWRTAGSDPPPTRDVPPRAALSDRFLPVPEALAPLVPFGGLRRGSAVRIEGSTSLLLALAAAACREGAWCVVVGMPDVGLAAAAEIGLPLDRVVLVPETGADSPEVLGAAIDGFDVVVLGHVPHLVDRDRRRLASRLRHREAVLVTAAPWPGSELVLSVLESRWEGIGPGHGSLRGRGLTVRVGGRGAAGGRAVLARLRSPDGVHLGLDGDGARPCEVGGRGTGGLEVGVEPGVGVGRVGLERRAG